MAGSTTAILGGGFGGLTVANILRGLLAKEHKILAIDASPKFHIGAAKTWVMLGERTAAQIDHPRSGLNRRGIEFIQDTVVKIDATSKTVTLANHNRSVVADYIVIALGADYDMGSVEGLKQSAETFYTL